MNPSYGPLRRPAANAFSALLSVSMLVGCSALQTAGPASMPADDPSETLAASAERLAPPPLKLEIRASGKEPEIRQVSVQPGMCIQDALKQAGLMRRFRRMDIELVRATSEGMAKLDSKYDHEADRMNPLYDYALHPGDHLIVTEDTSNMLDDMLGALPGLKLGRSR